RAGQDLIRIGEVQGLAEGLAESVVIVLEAKRGRLTKSLRQKIRSLGTDRLRQLLAAAVGWDSLDPLEDWLANHGE
ncbi:MAG: hypothetical protein KJ000_36390, partial [Pirellulaceae bacterium]|nr:hypothetical protein [Pirellulaceae bacterium]